MMSQDHSHYVARATQERRLALAATNPAARRAHLEMAVEYACRAGANPEIIPEQTRGGERRTA